MGTLLQVIKIARPGFWPTHLWFYLLPFATRDMFAFPAFWLGCAYVCFPLGLLLYGWNDLGDFETDRENERKDSWLFGAKPSGRMRAKLPVWIAGFQVPFVVLLIWFGGWRMLVWLIAVILVNFTYNTLKFKAMPLLDLLNQVGYLLIFVLASWLCDVPQLSMPAMAFSALFAMQSHLFGQLMDIECDKASGRRSTAVVLGVTPSKLLLVVIMSVEAVIAAAYFRSPIVAWLMAAAALFFVGDTLFGPPRYPIWFTKAFFIAWNVLVLMTMHWVWRYGPFLV